MPCLRSSLDSNETSKAPNRTTEGRFFTFSMGSTRGALPGLGPRAPADPFFCCVFDVRPASPKATTLIKTCSCPVLFPRSLRPTGLADAFAQPVGAAGSSNAVEWGELRGERGDISCLPEGMKEGGMRNVKRFFAAVIVGLFFVSVAAADTLELKSGKVVQGRYLGATAAILRFEVNGEVETFSTNDVVALTFTGRSGGATPMAAHAPAPAPAPAAPPPAPASAPALAAASAAPGGEVTIPAGQSLLIRMIDGVDSSKNHP